MARKLTYDEAGVLMDATATIDAEVDAETMLRALAEKQNRPLEITLESPAWLAGFTPTGFDS